MSAVFQGNTLVCPQVSVSLTVEEEVGGAQPVQALQLQQP